MAQYRGPPWLAGFTPHSAVVLAFGESGWDVCHFWCSDFSTEKCLTCFVSTHTWHLYFNSPETVSSAYEQRHAENQPQRPTGGCGPDSAGCPYRDPTTWAATITFSQQVSAHRQFHVVWITLITPKQTVVTFLIITETEDILHNDNRWK